MVERRHLSISEQEPDIAQIVEEYLQFCLRQINLSTNRAWQLSTVP